MPLLKSTSPANASVATRPRRVPTGDVIALSLSGTLILAAVVCFWCARRRLSARAVFPRDQAKREQAYAAYGMSAGDVLGQFDLRDSTPSTPPTDTLATGAATAADSTPVHSLHASRRTQHGRDCGDEGEDTSGAEPVVAPVAEEQAVLTVVALAEVRLVDDALGGVWATVREDSAASIPVRASLNLASSPGKHCSCLRYQMFSTLRQLSLKRLGLDHCNSN